MEPAMKKQILIASLLIGAASVWSAAAADKDRSYKFQEKEEIAKTLKFADPAKILNLTLDNVFGGIDVQAADVAAVELTAHKTIRAKTPEKMAKAKADVDIKITQDGNSIDLFVDGPFRCQIEGCKGINGRDFGYEVAYDFVLKVPRRTALTLKTINGGDIAVRGVEGDFDVSNVNGKVTLDKVAGSGDAHTVNGPVQAAFVRTPASACSFKTLNGAVTLTFPSGLGADFAMKTMNGEAYSDFAMSTLPAQPVKRETADGRTVFSQRGFTRVRVGRGGPEFKCETLNGDILIKKIG
jgi:hypothetical protein